MIAKGRSKRAQTRKQLGARVNRLEQEINALRDALRQPTPAMLDAAMEVADAAEEKQDMDMLVGYPILDLILRAAGRAAIAEADIDGPSHADRDALANRVRQLEEAINAALREIGEPGYAYPASPVSNAHALLRAALVPTRRPA